MWNKRSVDFLQDDGDKMELSSVFYKEKSLVVITNSSHLRCAHVQSIYSFKVYSVAHIQRRVCSQTKLIFACIS